MLKSCTNTTHKDFPTSMCCAILNWNVDTKKPVDRGHFQGQRGETRKIPELKEIQSSKIC